MIVSGTSHIRFGIDASGNYGYKKVGADTVTPFKSGSDYVTDVLFCGSIRGMTNWERSSTSSTSNFTINDLYGLVASAGMGTYTSSDYIDLTNYNKLYVTIQKVAANASTGCQVDIKIIDASGTTTKIYGSNAALSSKVTIDISSYSGKYKIQFYMYSPLSNFYCRIYNAGLGK